MNIFSATTKVNFELFAKTDGSLGKILANERYESAEIVILGCPLNNFLDAKNQLAEKDSMAENIRREFYKFTNFGINRKIFDLGNFNIQNSLEETVENYQYLVNQILQDRKRLIILGGGSDLAYLSGRTITQNFGKEWLAVNVSSHFGNSHFRLLEDNLLKSEYFYEVGYQNHLNSPIHFNKLQELKVNLISLEQLRSQETVDIRLREMMREKFVHHTSTLNTMFSFDARAVRSSDAPGSTTSSPIGLRAGEFLKLVEFARSLVNTKIIEFTEFSTKADFENRTAKLVAIAIHRICSNN